MLIQAKLVDFSSIVISIMPKKIKKFVNRGYFFGLLG
jgi:hypothetical protein